MNCPKGPKSYSQHRYETTRTGQVNAKGEQSVTRQCKLCGHVETGTLYWGQTPQFSLPARRGPA